MPFRMSPFYSASGKMCPVGYCPKCKKMSWFDIITSNKDGTPEFYICILCDAVFNPKEVKLEANGI